MDVVIATERNEAAVCRFPLIRLCDKGSSSHFDSQIASDKMWTKGEGERWERTPAARPCSFEMSIRVPQKYAELEGAV